VRACFLQQGSWTNAPCKGAYTLFTGQREREREGERKRERESQREREYLFLKGMTGALAPFSYLVYNNSQCGLYYKHDYDRN